MNISYYKQIDARLESAGGSTSAPDQDKLLDYLFFCLAYELKQDRDSVIFKEPEWTNAETSFSIVMYRSGHVAHDYCSSCIKALGAICRWECGPVKTACMQSKEERDEVKNKFESRLQNAQKQLAVLNGRTPQEYFFLKAHPVVLETASTDNNHFVILQADIRDAVDLLCVEETLTPWADYDRIRDYFEITVDDNSRAEIKVVLYRIRKQKKFIRYLKNLEKKLP
jgi:hypothetical protein